MINNERNFSIIEAGKVDVRKLGILSADLKLIRSARRVVDEKFVDILEIPSMNLNVFRSAYRTMDKESVRKFRTSLI
jgi:hypothetical protein